MLNNQPILIVEDDPLIAMCLADAVICLQGLVIGPIPSVKEAILLIGQNYIAAAILDANLRDRNVTPVALLLTKQGVPFVVHTAVGLPQELVGVLHGVPIVLKPQMPEVVVERLCSAIGARQGSPPMAHTVALQPGRVRSSRWEESS